MRAAGERANQLFFSGGAEAEAEALAGSPLRRAQTAAAQAEAKAFLRGVCAQAQRAEVSRAVRVASGIDGLLADTSSLTVMLQSIGRAGARGTVPVRARYYWGPEDCLISGDTLMMRWVYRTENAVQCGALCECYCQGMLKAQFTPNNKVATLEIAFDVMAFMQQLQRACSRRQPATASRTAG